MSNTEVKARYDQEVADDWCKKKQKELIEASEHQLRISLLAHAHGDKEAGTAHFESANKFAARSKFLEAHKFKTVAEAEKAIAKIR